MHKKTQIVLFEEVLIMKTRAKTASIARLMRSESTQTSDTYSREAVEVLGDSLSKSIKSRKSETNTGGKGKSKKKRRRLVKENNDVTNHIKVSKPATLPEEFCAVSSDVKTNTNKDSTENGLNENTNERINEEQETEIGVSRLDYPQLQLRLVTMETISTFPTKRGNITAMVSNESDKVWAVHNFGNIINCYTIDGKIENTLQVPVSVDDITICPDNSLILTEGCLSPGFGKSKIWKIEYDHKTVKPHETIGVSPLNARGIFSNNTDLYICCVDTNTVWRDGTNRRIVVKMTNKGQTLKTLDTNFLGEHLFTQPYRICVNKDGNIIVLDVQNVNQVKLFSSTGQLMSSFPGGSGISRNIVDVCCDYDGYIYVSDTVHNYVDMLYPNGTFCQTILTKKQGINAVQSIVIDPSGNLWVGNYSEIKVFKVLK